MRILPKVEERYECMYCGNVSFNKQEIIDCENLRTPNRLVNIKDDIIFMDEEITTSYNTAYNTYELRPFQDFKKIPHKFKIIDVFPDKHDMYYSIGLFRGDERIPVYRWNPDLCDDKRYRFCVYPLLNQREMKRLLDRQDELTEKYEERLRKEKERLAKYNGK